MKNKIIISVTGPKVLGGMTSYFYTAKKYFKKNVEYIVRGPRDSLKVYSKLSEYSRLLMDILNFIIKIGRSNVRIVHLNTSLGKRGIARDIVFIYLAKLFNKLTVVFFHGWDPKIEKEIDEGDYKLFSKYISQIDVAITLSNHSKTKLRNWGFQNKIYVDTTIVDDEEISGWDETSIKKKINEINNINNIEFLFLARIIKEKGVYEAVDTFKILAKKYQNISLSIAGDGHELDNLKRYVEAEKINNVKYYGYITGKEKVELLKRSHILIFPSYTEGMPISVLEAMAFGLIIVTRPVGGLVDFFTDEMGIMIDTLNPNVFTENIGNLLEKDLLNISIGNYLYAKKRFYASIAVKRIENIYKELLTKNS